MREHRQLLVSALASVGVSAGARELDMLLACGEMLIEKNRVMNLTAIDDPEGVILRHLADSAALLPLLSGSERAIDVGCGAGFPGIPVRILAGEGLRLTLLDATGKKVEFLREVCAELGLSGVECLHARAEEAARQPELREGFSAVFSRAVARLDMLCELCLPFAAPGGTFFAHKGPRSDEELAGAERAIALLGGESAGKHPYRTAPSEPEQYILRIEKKKPVPPAYPRAWAKIKSKPL